MDAFWIRKQRVFAKQELPGRRYMYEPIEVPKNTPTGVLTAFFAVVTGFALIWHIWWMASFGVLGGAVTLLAFMFRKKDEVEIPADEVGLFDRAHAVEVSP